MTSSSPKIERLDEIVRFVEQYQLKFPKKVLEIAREGLSLAKELKKEKIQCDLHVISGNLYVGNKEFINAQRYLAKGLKICKESLNDPSAYSKIYNGLGRLYGMQREWQNALDYLNKALKLEILEQHPPIYNNISIVYLHHKKYDDALRYSEKGLVIAQKLNNKRHIATCLISIANIFFHQKDYKKAKKYYLDGLIIIEKQDNLQLMCCRVLYNIGLTYQATYQFTEALHYYQTAINLAELYTYHQYIASLYYRIGDINLQQGNQEKYLFFLDKGLIIGKKHKLISIQIEGFNRLYTYYKRLEDYQIALKFHIEILALERKKNRQQQRQNLSALLEEKEEEIVFLKEKNTQIESQNKELERTNIELKEYAHVVAHDLKEPLRIISSFAIILQDRYSIGLAKDAVEFLEYIVKNTQHMDAVLTDLLKYAELSREAIKMEWIDLEEIIQFTKELLQGNIVSSNTQIITKKLPVIYTNKTFVIQLFQNLIHNSIKFRSSDRDCIIEISVVEKEDSFLCKVQDNGIGIKKEYQDKIFKMFRRLDRHNYEGTGIGLAICKRVVERLGGNISLESKVGIGTCFIFDLPKNEEVKQITNSVI